MFIKSRPSNRWLTCMASVLLCIIGLCTPQLAHATDRSQLPAFRFPPVELGSYINDNPIEGSSGSTTIPCSSWYGGSDLISVSHEGQVFRRLDRTQIFDGKQICFSSNAIAVNKDDLLFGLHIGNSGQWLLAYQGNNMVWNHKLSGVALGYDTATEHTITIGVDGNLYLIVWENAVPHLQRISPSIPQGKAWPRVLKDVVVNLPLNDTTIGPVAFSEGIVLYGIRTAPTYYNYEGVKLGRMYRESGFHYSSISINSSGVLFYTKLDTISSGEKSLTVVRFDYKTNTFQSTLLSVAPSINTGWVALQSTPDGGVVVSYSIWRDLLGSRSFATIVGSDLSVKDVGQLSETDCSGIDGKGCRYGNPFLAADATGKVAIMQQIRIPIASGIRAADLGGAMRVILYDTVSSAWTHSYMMIRDTNPFSDWNTVNVNRHVSMNKGAIHLLIKCTSDRNASCGPTGSSNAFYSIASDGVGISYPEATIASGSIPAPLNANYVAMGDSFSSGEGVEPFTAESGRATAARDHTHGYLLSTLRYIWICAKTFHVLGRRRVP